LIAHHDALRIGQRNSERCCRQLISGFRRARPRPPPPLPPPRPRRHQGIPHGLGIFAPILGAVFCARFDLLRGDRVIWGFDRAGVWLSAMGCSLLVSMASLVCLVLLPIIFCKCPPAWPIEIPRLFAALLRRI
jgi:hypothetical protein